MTIYFLNSYRYIKNIRLIFYVIKITNNRLLLCDDLEVNFKNFKKINVGIFSLSLTILN